MTEKLLKEFNENKDLIKIFGEGAALQLMMVGGVWLTCKGIEQDSLYGMIWRGFYDRRQPVFLGRCQ
jgi:hypothetical protein